jgi:spoIIIJ-associated protein
MTPKETLDTMLGYLGFVCEIEETRSETGGLLLQVHSPENELLIGRRGETLEQIQFLLNRVLQAEDHDAPRVQVDVEHYRLMKVDDLVARVKHLAESVKATGLPVQLEPMNSYQRHIVHNAFKDDPDVMTWSPADDARLKRITLKPRTTAS